MIFNDEKYDILKYYIENNAFNEIILDYDKYSSDIQFIVNKN